MRVRTPNCCCEFGIDSDLPLWRCDSLLVIYKSLRGAQTRSCVFLRSEVAAGNFITYLGPSMLEEETLTVVPRVDARMKDRKGNNLKVAV